jgi:phosphate transport system substrate-binding protein
MARSILVVGVLAMSVAGFSGAFALDQALPIYQTVEGPAGHLKSVGSDTLGHQMMLWAKAFEGLYPDVRIEIEAAGSATAPAALLEGRSQFGPMSRPMTEGELAAFENRYGYKIAKFRVAVDALAVYVNKDNPITCLTMPQLSGIFASTRKTVGSTNAKTWGDLGLGGEWASRPITLYSRNSLSGTYEYFRETALYGGEYKPDVKQLSGSEAVVKAVADDKYGIGYSGVGYKTEGVRIVPLSAYYGSTCYDASAEATLTGKYPIARYLYVYLNKKPNAPLEPVRAEFVKYILSKDGQEQTEKSGFFPITAEIRAAELTKLGIPTAP